MLPAEQPTGSLSDSEVAYHVEDVRLKYARSSPRVLRWVRDFAAQLADDHEQSGEPVKAARARVRYAEIAKLLDEREG